MYSVYIVDDEMLARVGIKSLIDWEKHGFQIVGEADNGEKALEGIVRLNPDIVITDFKMPIMDGAELLTRCKQMKLPAKFIVLSAFGDYEYVRTTLRDGAVDYLLKLELEPDTLLAALQKTVELIAQDKTIDLSQTEVDVKAGYLRHAYRSLIHGSSADKTAAYCKLITELGYPRRDVALVIYKILRHDGTGLTSAEFGDSVGTIINTIDEIARLNSPSVTLSLHRDSLVCTVLHSPGSIDVMNTTTVLSLRIRETLKYLFNYNVYLGCSLPKEDLPKLNEAYCEALDAVNRAEMFDLEVCIAQPHVNQAPTDLNIENLTEQMSRATEQLDFASIQHTFRSIYACLLEGNSISSQQMVDLCYLVLFLLNNIKRKMGMNDNLIMESRHLYYRRIRNLSGYESSIALLRDLEMEFEKLIAGDELYRSIARAKAYVDNHLSEDLSLESVAEHVSLSPNYFSKLFHQEVGERFTAYVNHKRINSAKAMLLLGNLRIGEIAEQLGFENTTYFSKVFKKITGVTPQSYKQSAPSLKQ